MVRATLRAARGRGRRGPGGRACAAAWWGAARCSGRAGAGSGRPADLAQVALDDSRRAAALARGVAAEAAGAPVQITTATWKGPAARPTFQRLAALPPERCVHTASKTQDCRNTESRRGRGSRGKHGSHFLEVRFGEGNVAQTGVGNPLCGDRVHRGGRLVSCSNRCDQSFAD
jgi:hypothetical protein